VRSRVGYISPVSTLIKWFPDRRGMATGLAIMGFGGGALIGAPLADIVDAPLRRGAAPAYADIRDDGPIYFTAMTAGALPVPDRPGMEPAG